MVSHRAIICSLKGIPPALEISRGRKYIWENIIFGPSYLCFGSHHLNWQILTDELRNCWEWSEKVTIETGNQKPLQVDPLIYCSKYCWRNLFALMVANNQLIMNYTLYPGVRNPYIHPIYDGNYSYNSSLNSRHLIELQTQKRIFRSLRKKIIVLKCELNVPYTSSDCWLKVNLEQKVKL